MRTKILADFRICISVPLKHCQFDEFNVLMYLAQALMCPPIGSNLLVVKIKFFIEKLFTEVELSNELHFRKST